MDASVARAAQRRQLGQRDAVGAAAADVVDAAGIACQVGDLQPDEIVEIGDVQHVTDLQPLAAEPDVGETAAIQMPRRPQDDESLIDLAHLPRAGNHAASVDDRPQAVHRAVLLDQQLGGELGRAVHRAKARQREVRGDALVRPARRRRRVRQIRVSIAAPLERQRAQRCDRIDAARREEHDVGVGATRRLQAMDRAGQVGLRARTTGCRHSRHARTARRSIRSAGRRRPPPRDRPATAHVAVDELDAGMPEPAERQLAAAAAQVVERRGYRRPGRSRFSISARLDPTKPAPPVIRIRMRRSGTPRVWQTRYDIRRWTNRELGRCALDPLYATRFPEADRGAKDAIWQVLCPHFFQRYVRETTTVLDIGAGFGEFLRHIRCARRIAVDIERLSGRVLPPGTEEVFTPSHRLSEHVAADSVDVVFCSNFFEHLPGHGHVPGDAGGDPDGPSAGRTPARAPAEHPADVGGAYWDFVDHHLPLTDRSLVEACQSLGFEIVEVIPRFLPYTTRSALPQSPWLVRLVPCRSGRPGGSSESRRSWWPGRVGRGQGRVSAHAIPRDAAVYVAGHRGLVGSALARRLTSAGFTNILGATREQLDLRDQAAVNYWFKANRPEYVFLVAGTVGGILANSTRPAEFIYDNLMIHATITHASHVHGVKRLLYLGSSCIYPRDCRPADCGGGPPDRAARADERAVRHRQDLRHPAVPGVPAPVRLRTSSRRCRPTSTAPATISI